MVSQIVLPTRALEVAREELPAALAGLHRQLSTGTRLDLRVRHGDGAARPTGWHAHRLADVVAGGGFDVDTITVEGLAQEWLRVRATRDRTLPDTVGAGMRLLVCGLNPSLHAADAGFGFAGPSNRFWSAAGEAGLISVPREPMRALVVDRVGMTDIVKRATPRASMLAPREYRDGMRRVERLVAWLQPGAVCFVGLGGWRAARDASAIAGRQVETIGGRPVYVMPSTSGLNARVARAELVEHLRAAAALADSG